MRILFGLAVLAALLYLLFHEIPQLENWVNTQRAAFAATQQTERSELIPPAASQPVSASAIVAPTEATADSAPSVVTNSDLEQMRAELSTAIARAAEDVRAAMLNIHSPDRESEIAQETNDLAHYPEDLSVQTSATTPGYMTNSQRRRELMLLAEQMELSALDLSE